MGWDPNQVHREWRAKDFDPALARWYRKRMFLSAEQAWGQLKVGGPDDARRFKEFERFYNEDAVMLGSTLSLERFCGNNAMRAYRLDLLSRPDTHAGGAIRI